MASEVLPRARRELGLLSVVTPMYNEEETAQAFYTRVRDALAAFEWELVIVNDGSKDRTPEILRAIAAEDPRVKVIDLARNFGHQPALTAGLEHARGEAVCMIDADLQDPPELIVEMVSHWQAGSDVVYAVREARAGETRFKLATAHIFYRLFRRLAQIDLPADAGDFRLMDRTALESLLSMRERNRFLRGMTVWVGGVQTAVHYQRDARYGGETKYTLRKMVNFSADAIVSFSNFPLQLAMLLGFACSLLAFLLIPVVIAARLFEEFVPGVSSTLVVILLMSGIQLITVGIIGEYVGRIYDEVKRRPLYLVKERLNMGAEETPRVPEVEAMPADAEQPTGEIGRTR